MFDMKTDDMTSDQRAKFLMVTGDLARLNASIRDAVDTGLSIELTRSARHHDSGGCWGDIMMPRVVRRRG